MKTLIIAPPASYSPDYKSASLAPKLPSAHAPSKSAGEPRSLDVATGSPAPVCEGMYISDRCQFCCEYDEKVKPWICGYCWEAIKEIVGEYRAELLETKQENVQSEPRDQ